MAPERCRLRSGRRRAAPTPSTRKRAIIPPELRRRPCLHEKYQAGGHGASTLKPTSPGFRVRCERSIALLGFLSNNNRTAAALWTTKVASDRAEALEPLAPASSRRTSAVVICHTGTPGSSCRCRCRRHRGGPQSGDQHQDFRDHLPRHRGLGHSERDAAAMADHLGADLDRLSPQARLGTRLRVRGPTKTNPLRV